jgi:putative CocE/NonD family hydrolase
MKSFGHKNQKLILGPWGHTDTASRLIGRRDFTKNAVIDLQREYLRWFDFWLKGIDNKVIEEPWVKMFTMGSNRWHSGDTYPLEGTEFRKIYLASDTGANSGKGDGRLVWEILEGTTEADAFTYDPGDPTPDPEFYPTKSKEEKEKETVDSRKEERKLRAFHQKVTDERKDILVYRTDPLTKPLTICGPLSAVLFASTTAKDTDWFITLCEETERSSIFPLATGKVRARFRNSPFQSEPLEPGKVYKYILDMWQTGITFPEGSCIRIEVASAQFPTFSRNLNTGGHNEMESDYVKAEQKVFHSKEYPSHVLLPVLPEEE